MQLAFLRQVGCHGERGRIVPALIAALEAIAPIPNTDALPRDIWQLLVTPAKETADMSWRDVAASLGVAYNGSAAFASGVSRARLATLAKTLSSETLLHLAESDVYWDEVTAIERLDIEDVYDITVPGTHNFVADDFIVHNSLEQDADVVMFIHREDKMTEGAEKTGVAEILIEKHRNGPLGKIDLRFDEEKTTFLPIDKSDFGDFTPEAQVEEEKPF